jgi:hypothetical protein
MALEWRGSLMEDWGLIYASAGSGSLAEPRHHDPMKLNARLP